MRFETGLAPAPITLPSHGSIFTGLYPFEHGVRNNGNFYLAERLPDAGHRAQGARLPHRRLRQLVHPRPPLRPRPRLRRLRRPHGGRVRAGGDAAGRAARRPHGARARPLARRARRSSRSAPFFAWLHLYDPHEPYRPPRPFRDLFAERPVRRRDRLRRRDPRLGARPPARGRPARPHAGRGDRATTARAWASTARRRTRCSSTKARSACRSCCGGRGSFPPGRVVSDARAARRRRADAARAARRAAARAPHARSLVPLIEGRSGRPRAPPAYAETLLPKFYMNWAPLRALRDGRYKLIDAPRPELYDLATRPRRVANLYAERGADGRGAAPGARAARRGGRRDERADARPRGDGEAGRARLHRRRRREPQTARSPRASRTRRTSSRSSTGCARPTARCASGASRRRCRS